jgi:hypothetical protein
MPAISIAKNQNASVAEIRKNDSEKSKQIVLPRDFRLINGFSDMFGFWK